MRLYHGSKLGLMGAISLRSRAVCDFGCGFYMGDTPQQPQTLICRTESPRFYELDETECANLRRRSDVQRQRAEDMTNRIFRERRHLDGTYFDELCERLAKGEPLK